MQGRVVDVRPIYIPGVILYQVPGTVYSTLTMPLYISGLLTGQVKPHGSGWVVDPTRAIV